MDATANLPTAVAHAVGKQAAGTGNDSHSDRYFSANPLGHPQRRRPPAGFRASSRRSAASRRSPCRAWSGPACRCECPTGPAACVRRKGIMFLFTVMPHSVPSASSACLAGEPQRRDVGQHQVVVGAAADQPHAAGHERLGQGLGIVDDLLRVLLELGRKASPKQTALPATTCISGPP